MRKHMKAQRRKRARVLDRMRHLDWCRRCRRSCSAASTCPGRQRRLRLAGNASCSHKSPWAALAARLHKRCCQQSERLLAPWPLSSEKHAGQRANSPVWQPRLYY